MDKFDFIVVGGGSAGCVLANRLTEDPEITVLLLESGTDDKTPAVQIPAGAVSIVPTRYKNWAFETIKQTGLNHRKGYQPRGKVLGGSSSINAMIYVRGHQQDYDDWHHLGWDWQTVLPYFIKSENNQNGGDALHGQTGPLYVSNSRSNHSVANDFVRSGIANDLPHNLDFNGPSQEGVGRYQVTQKEGLRCSAAKAYLDPIRYRKNLKIMTNIHVRQLHFNDKTCVAVACQRGDKHYRFSATKEVILSAGTFGSPHLLLLSGVGPKQQLATHNIELVHDLPGVGENLQDHPDYVATYRSHNYRTFGLSIPGIAYFIKHVGKFLFNRHGLLTSNFAETGGFIKTDPELERPDIQFHFVVASVKDHARDWRASLKHGYSCHTCVLRPKSKGTVRLKDNNPETPLDIDPQFLQSQDDVTTLRKGVRVAANIMQHEFMSKHQLVRVGKTNLNKENNIKKSALDENDMTDAELEQHLRQHTDSVYHPIGTCKMSLPDDPMGVVSPQLLVHGLTNVRVVDASIMPNLIGGNTNAPTMMIAERASDIIKQHWQLNNFGDNTQ